MNFNDKIIKKYENEDLAENKDLIENENFIENEDFNENEEFKKSLSQENFENITNEIILLIMNCKKYNKKKRFQEKTWLNNLPSHILYYHIIGNSQLKKDYEFDNINNILYVCCNDDYCNLPKKVIRSYEAIYNHFKNLKYIFKTDDDQIIYNLNFFNTLTDILKNKENTIHYGGNIIHVSKPSYCLYHQIHPVLPKNIVLKPTKYSNGRFYFLSKKSIKHLIKKKKLIDEEYIEDYAIGFYLDQKLKEYMLHINTDCYFRDIDDLIEWKQFN
jgi:hypothetical protein